MVLRKEGCLLGRHLKNIDYSRLGILLQKKLCVGDDQSIIILHLLFLFRTDSELRATVLMESSAVILGPLLSTDVISGPLDWWKTMAKMTGGFWHVSASVLSCLVALLVGQRENGNGALLHVHLHSLIETFHESWFHRVTHFRNELLISEHSGMPTGHFGFQE